MNTAFKTVGSDEMESNVSNRQGLVVWLYTAKYLNKLKQYGYVHYVSRKLKYAILYVDASKAKNVQDQLGKQHFVRSIELSHYSGLDDDYTGLLEELDQKAKEVNADNNGIDLFTQL